jgi:ABC-2 type transport system permease protein
MSATAIEPTEIRGPSALGGSPRRFFHLTWLIASTDYKLTYFGSALGYIWSFAQPLMFFGVLYFVFAVLLKGSLTRAKDFPMLLLMNIVLFNFFAQATSASVSSVVGRENLVRKMHFPRLVIPLAVVLTAGFQLTLNLAVVLVFFLVYGVQPQLTWLLLPVIVLMLATLVSGCAMILSALYVRYRDIAPIWSVIAQALFYASPIFIMIETVRLHGERLTRAYLSNPLAAILQQARHWMIGGSPGTAFWMGGYVWLLIPIGITAAIVGYGYWVFNREAPRIAEEL